MGRNQAPESEAASGRVTVLFAAPIASGRSEAWRRFLQEMLAWHRAEYEESRRNLGIREERIWLAETVNGAVAVVAVTAVEPERVLARLATSDLAVDRHFREQLLRLQGLDLTRSLKRTSPELVLEWQATRGSRPVGLRCGPRRRS